MVTLEMSTIRIIKISRVELYLALSNDVIPSEIQLEMPTHLFFNPLQL